MTEYVAKFTQLSRYALNVVADEQMQAQQFQEGLRLNILEHRWPPSCFVLTMSLWPCSCYRKMGTRFQALESDSSPTTT